MSKDCSAYRSVGYIHVRDGKAHSDGEGEVGEVELIRSLLAWKGKPSGRFFGSIVKVSVVECKRTVQYSPRRDNSSCGHESHRDATCSIQVAYSGHQPDCQRHTHQAYKDDEKQ
jgi:hypothetical protein